MIFITDVDMICPEAKDFVFDMLTGNFDMVTVFVYFLLNHEETLE